MSIFLRLFQLNKWIIDKGGMLLSALRLSVLLKDRNILKKNEDIVKHKTSNVCYILGLGPSLKSVDLNKIDGDTFAINGYVFFEDSSKRAPTFYCLVDDAFYDGFAVKTFNKAVESFPNTVFLLNGKYRRESERIINNRVARFYLYCWKGYFKANENLKLTDLLPITGNVVNFAIMIAIMLGYRKVILLGCDFNSFAYRKPIHCYKEISEKKAISLAFELFCYSFVANIHELLNIYAIKKGVKIINASEGSLIDAYEYDEMLIKKLSKKE